MCRASKCGSAVPNSAMDLVWGSKFCGAGEWPVGKHRKKTRRSWRKLHIGIDPNKGEIVIAALTTNDVDDPCPIGHVLEQPDSGTGGLGHRGWRYDQDSVYRAVIDHDPDARIIVPPRLAQQALPVADAIGRYKQTAACVFARTIVTPQR
jgi:hypothetical protein